jgi:hypothetical protein
VCSGGAERALEEAPDSLAGGGVWGTYAFEFSGASGSLKRKSETHSTRRA